MRETMKTDIESLINLVVETDSKNQLTIQQVQDWLARYLAAYDDELVRFPELAAKPYVDVIAADFVHGRPAFFIVAMLTGKTVRIAAGLADGHALRSFLEQEFPDDPGEIINELSQRFTLADRQLTVDRQAIENWSQ